MLEEAKRVQRLVANLSHELRTPLNAIVGSVALLTSASAPSPEHRGHIERLQRNSRHLLRMIDDVFGAHAGGIGTADAHAWGPTTGGCH